MKAQTETSVAKTAYGKTLETPISYDYSWKDYESIEEVKAANDTLTDDEIVKVRNTERKANSRQKALQAALDAAGIIKPDIENDPQMRLRKMADIFEANGNPPDVAKQLASAALNIAWD